MEHIDKTLITIEFDKVLQLLSQFALSELGKEKCLSLLPLKNKENIKKQLKIVSQAQDVYRLSGNNLPFSLIPDISLSINKLKNRLTLSFEEIKEIYYIIVNSRCSKSFLNRYSDEFNELCEYNQSLFVYKETEDKIESIFDENFNIKETASVELKSLYQSKRSLNENLKDTVNSLMNNSSFNIYLQDLIHTIRDGRVVFQVKAEAKNKVSGIIHDVSQSGQTFYIEPKQIVGLNNKIRETEIAIETEIAKILRDLSLLLADITEGIDYSFQTLVELDFVFAKAKYASFINACEPEITDNKILDLKDMKNPVLMSVCDNVVVNDFAIGNPYKSVIITGSNAGGKTVMLKGIGLAIAMAEAGMHVACFSAKIYPFQKLYAEIGDEQNIIQSLSTFSSHIKHIKNILDNADRETFIIIDEIAAGTDPKEGAALAKSLMEEFVNCGAESVITTHFSELKSLPFDNEDFQNASVDFNTETLKPTYKLRMGVPGSSNAFAIAKNLGIDKKIVDRASVEYSASSSDEAKILLSLQEKYSELHKLTEEANDLKLKSEEKFNLYNDLYDKLNADKRKFLSEFKKKYEAALANAKGEIRQVLDSLNKNRSRENAIKSYKKLSENNAHLNDLTENDLKTISPKYIDFEKEEIKIGSKAVIKDLDQTAEILSLPDKNGNLTVLIGLLKTSVNIAKLAKSMKVKKTVVTKKYKSSNSGFEFARLNMSPKLDLRGERVDDALSELEVYLDKASLVNLSPVQIIHGHGTGQLRHAVRNYLADSPYVAKYRPGETSEGGDGVTIVDIN